MIVMSVCTVCICMYVYVNEFTYLFMYLEIFETKDVQDTNEPGVFRTWICASIDLVNQPSKGPGVQSLSHGMSVLFRLRRERSQRTFMH